MVLSRIVIEMVSLISSQRMTFQSLTDLIIHATSNTVQFSRGKIMAGLDLFDRFERVASREKVDSEIATMLSELHIKYMSHAPNFRLFINKI